MTDKQFLFWIYRRLADVHGENLNVDYMHRMRALIVGCDFHKTTPNLATSNEMIISHMDEPMNLQHPEDVKQYNDILDNTNACTEAAKVVHGGDK